MHCDEDPTARVSLVRLGLLGIPDGQDYGIPRNRIYADKRQMFSKLETR